jgi:hypothetical protein
MTRPPLFPFFVLLFACTGTSSGSSLGTVGGQAFIEADAMAADRINGTDMFAAEAAVSGALPTRTQRVDAQPYTDQR